MAVANNNKAKLLVIPCSQLLPPQRSVQPKRDVCLESTIYCVVFVIVVPTATTTTTTA